MPKNDVPGFLIRRLLFSIILGLFLMVSSKVMADSSGRNIEAIKTSIPDSTVIENKVVYVDFWASWCMPCRKSFPWMESLQKKYGDSGLTIVTINVDKDPKAAQKFLDENKLQSIAIFDSGGKLAESFELKVMPTSFIFDKTGKLVISHEGFKEKEKDEIEKKIVTLLHGEKLEAE